MIRQTCLSTGIKNYSFIGCQKHINEYLTMKKIFDELTENDDELQPHEGEQLTSKTKIEIDENLIEIEKMKIILEEKEQIMNRIESELEEQKKILEKLKETICDTNDLIIKLEKICEIMGINFYDYFESFEVI